MASEQAPPQGPPQGEPQINFSAPPGQPQPTPEQIEIMRKQLFAEAEKQGLSVPEYLQKMRQQQMQQQAQQQQLAQQQQQPQQQPQQPIQPGPPKPEALAVANFLKGQDLKLRTCILNGQRKDMFKGIPSRQTACDAAAC